MARGAWRSASPYLLLTLTTLFWAGNAVVARALHDLVPPIAMAFWRWTLASVLLLPFVIRPLCRQRAALRKNIWRLLLLGGLGVSGFNTFLYAALQTTSATNGVLINAITPLLIVVFSRLLFAVRMTWRQQAGIALSLAGVMMIVSRGDRAVLAALDFDRGDLLLLGGVCCWALYTACLRWRPSDIDARGFLGATIMIGAVLLLPLYLVEMAMGRHAVWNAASLSGQIYFAVFPSILSYLFWNRGVKEIGANRAGMFMYLVPLFGVALAGILLGEALHAFHLAGAALIFAGIYFSMSDARQSPNGN